MRYIYRFITLSLLALAGCEAPPTYSTAGSNTSISTSANTTPTTQAPVSPPSPAILAQQKNCIACHRTNDNLVGPSWKNIANKYKGDNTASDRLAEKVLKGGSGSFGSVTMPPHQGQMTAQEAHYLVEWILKMQ